MGSSNQVDIIRAAEIIRSVLPNAQIGIRENVGFPRDHYYIEVDP